MNPSGVFVVRVPVFWLKACPDRIFCDGQSVAGQRKPLARDAYSAQVGWEGTRT